MTWPIRGVSDSHMVNLIWSCLIGGALVANVFLAYYGKMCWLLTDKTHKDPVVPVKLS